MDAIGRRLDCVLPAWTKDSLYSSSLMRSASLTGAVTSTVMVSRSPASETTTTVYARGSTSRPGSATTWPSDATDSHSGAPPSALTATLVDGFRDGRATTVVPACTVSSSQAKSSTDGAGFAVVGLVVVGCTEVVGAGWVVSGCVVPGCVVPGSEEPGVA